MTAEGAGLLHSEVEVETSGLSLVVCAGLIVKHPLVDTHWVLLREGFKNSSSID